MLYTVEKPVKFYTKLATKLKINFFNEKFLPYLNLLIEFRS